MTNAKAQPLPPAAHAATASGNVAPAHAEPPAPGLALRAQALLRFIGMPIYDVQLWVDAGFQPARWFQHPLALVLQYRRAFTGRDIAQRSLQEMQRAGPLPPAQAERWTAWMLASFPDVQPGDRLAGLWQPATQATRIVGSGGSSAELVDATFGPRFFGIWLSEWTSAPSVRSQLLGTP